MLSDIFVDNHGTGYQNVTGGDGPQTNINGVSTQNNYYGPVQDPQIIKAETRRREEKARRKEEKTRQHEVKAREEDEKRLRREREDCLGCLSFPSMNARRDNIGDAHSNTCDWLFNTTEFTEWRRRDELPTHNGILWIKGKPGAGKSTLMNHTLSYCERALHDHLIVSYFFNARGGALEKTPLGMMRSIVYQLLRTDDTLYRAFLDSYRENVRISRGGELQWQVPQLKKFIQSITKQPHLHSKPLLLLVDALDECAEEEVRDVVGFLETLSVNAVNFGVELRICLSSRHYPSIGMKKNLELIVEVRQEHGTDIAAYIQERLNTDDGSLEDRVREKAHGIFLWVVLVVAMLNKAYDEGRHEAMQKTLDELPEGLEGMFDTILGQGDSDKTELVSMFQWVLFSQRPLSSKELYTAVVNRSLPSSETIRRRITTSSKGLIEVRKEVRKKVCIRGHVEVVFSESVQFIHLSVKDFLCRNKRLEKLDPSLRPDAISVSHARLWAYCWSCIRDLGPNIADTSNRVEMKSTESRHFIKYAAEYIIVHAEEALANNEIGHRLDREMGEWIRARDGSLTWLGWLQTLGDPFTRRVAQLNTGIGGLIYLLAHAPYPNLLGFAVRIGADINTPVRSCGHNALETSSAAGHETGVKLLLEKGASRNCEALLLATINGRYGMAKLLIRGGANVDEQCGLFGTVLQAVCEGPDNGRGGRRRIPCLCGGNYGYHDKYRMAKLLLKSGADVNAKGGKFGTALQAAAYRGSYYTARLLIESGADVNAKGGRLGTALQAAAYHGECRIAKLLIKSGADVNAKGGKFGTALQAAYYAESSRLVALLIESGAEGPSKLSRVRGFRNILQMFK
ncbi:hypothetical protein F5X98DRAFT_387040 [Xylaria grammica]|nr:hypothetical protein F5X98DRAFT_387040 [Xylaria grammica]